MRNFPASAGVDLLLADMTNAGVTIKQRDLLFGRKLTSADHGVGSADLCLPAPNAIDPDQRDRAGCRKLRQRPIDTIAGGAGYDRDLASRQAERGARDRGEGFVVIEAHGLRLARL